MAKRIANRRDGTGMDKPKNGGINPIYLATLQANGLACTECGIDFRRVNVVSVSVATSETGRQLFACKSHGIEPEKNGEEC